MTEIHIVKNTVHFIINKKKECGCIIKKRDEIPNNIGRVIKTKNLEFKKGA